MPGILSKPFPSLSEIRLRLRSVLLISFFVFLFLSVFQPFGIATIQGPILLITLGYGMITLTCLLLTKVLAPRLFPTYFDENAWTVGKEILHTMLNIMGIAVVNFLYSTALGFFPLSTTTLLLFIGFTLAVGAFPVGLQVLIRQNIYQRKNAAAAEADNAVLLERKPEKEIGKIKIQADDGKIEFEGSSDELQALEASGNYVMLHLKSASRPTLIRATLSALEEMLPECYFRSHRSWLINLEAVKKVDGNARGYQVQLDSEVIASVSRSRLKAFDAHLRKRSHPSHSS